ncbi:uncharacterized protein LOC135829577 [Sycon ciliatum]|uniref:uncharacterized protein LOC135829577 n=1 Tax=Sycon ciliatum TaxID=27933 RepID=UPI0020A95D32|eukprot:scpid57088/ scgid35373/ 
MASDLVDSLEESMKDLVSLALRGRSEITLFGPEMTQDEHEQRLQEFIIACRKLEAFFVLKQQSAKPDSDTLVEKELKEIRARIEAQKAALVQHRSTVQQCMDLLEGLQKKSPAQSH